MCADHQQLCLARLLYTDTLMFLILDAVCAWLLSCLYGDPAPLMSSLFSHLKMTWQEVGSCRSVPVTLLRLINKAILYGCCSYSLRLCMFFSVCTHNAVRHCSRFVDYCRLAYTYCATLASKSPYLIDEMEK